ncbi:hypothetical protein [Erythrobacter mangrovi]|uniref:Uncharacterized protein n=1 Tax=Erythrobacter mangrovi TaxID=2739433 RepID=A0A7D3XPS8_9SPHN|nr:hypothetical protein [Erythrobacter mangrovi]QKG71034.1 hypothetical protein HQR01_06405 [Erythrobacter mangrovi]
MNLSPALLQFVGSLVAILALAWVARWLKLGPQPRLHDESEARRAADEAVSGYAPVAIALDREGYGALMRDAAGRVLLLRPHGTHFAGRILAAGARAQLDGEALVVDSGERRYGQARLTVPNPQQWAREINAQGSR